MFYAAEAALYGLGLSYSSHSAVHAAFGSHCAKSGRIPAEHHRRLIEAMETRQAGDYGDIDDVSEDEARVQIDRAVAFLVAVRALLDAP